MSLSSLSESKSLLDRSEKDYSDIQGRSASGRSLPRTASATERPSVTSKESARTKASKESQDKSKSKEAFDEVSIEGPKKSDGSEFKKGPKGWAMSFTYLGILWIFGFLFTTLIMFLLLIQIEDKPHYFGRGSHIGGTPGLVFEPNPSRFDVGTKGVIRFESADPSSYHNHLIRYKMILKAEYNDTNSSKPLCAKASGSEDGAPTMASVCRVEADSSTHYGPCALSMQNINRGMGFSTGEPCIMLRLTRILGWYPDDFVDSKGRKCIRGSTLCCNRKRLQFTCDAVKGSATIKMLPKDGISLCAFPFWNQEGYEQPFVMLKISNLNPGTNEINCRPTQESIQHLDDGQENVLKLFIEKLD